MDVTGLVLTIGEKTTQRAIKSLKKQTLPLKKIVVIKNTSPFHRSMNKGIAQVKTPFFLQCDADMIPDPDCVATMLKFMRPDIGIVKGMLFDPLMSKIQAIKMFRTECFKNTKFPNNISPDTECLLRLKKLGWGHIFAKRKRRRHQHDPDVLGCHQPEYTPAYTFKKFKLLGSRMRYRDYYGEFDATMKKLRNSPHPMSLIAMVALSHGLFFDKRKDGLKPAKIMKDYNILMKYMNSRNQKNAVFAVTTSRGTQ